MFGLQQAIGMLEPALNQMAAETPEERDDRLGSAAAGTDFSKAELKLLEDQLKEIGREVQQETAPDAAAVEKAAEQTDSDDAAATLGGFGTILRTDAMPELVARLLVKNPEKGAWVVKRAGQAFSELGAYED